MKALVGMIVILTAIVPSMTLGAELCVGKVLKAAPNGFDITRQVLDVDARNIAFSGNRGYSLRQSLEGILSDKLAGTHAEVTRGSQFKTLTGVQDRIHNSGRYSVSSRQAVPRGQMLAPTIVVLAEVTANVIRQQDSGNLRLAGKSARVRSYKTTVTVELTLSFLSVSGGKQIFACTVETSADRSDKGLTLAGGRSFGSTQRMTTGEENKLLEDALTDAVDACIAQI